MNKGDIFKNLIIAATPGGIEAQERSGQIAFVANETLPIKCNWGTSRAQLEEIGIQYGDPADDLFVNVKLPEGWSKVGTNHSMWSKLIDEQGRERASIFYKAAFYDRDAFINIVPRFRAKTMPVTGYESPDYDHDTTPVHGVVMDQETVIWHTAETATRPPQDASRSETMAFYDLQDDLGKRAKAWLSDHYPDWENPVAYWDLPPLDEDGDA